MLGEAGFIQIQNPAKRSTSMENTVHERAVFKTLKFVWVS
jgi:hypothetical protein